MSELMDKIMYVAISLLIVATFMPTMADFFIGPANTGGWSTTSNWIYASQDIYANDTSNLTESAMRFSLANIHPLATVQSGLLCVQNTTSLGDNVTLIRSANYTWLETDITTGSEYNTSLPDSTTIVSLDWSLTDGRYCVSLNSTSVTSADITNDAVTLKLKDPDGVVSFNLTVTDTPVDGATLLIGNGSASPGIFNDREVATTSAPRIRLTYQYTSSLVTSLMSTTLGVFVIAVFVVIWVLLYKKKGAYN